MAYDSGKHDPDVQAARKREAAFLKLLRHKRSPAVQAQRKKRADRLRYLRIYEAALAARGPHAKAVDRKTYFDELQARHPTFL